MLLDSVRSILARPAPPPRAPVDVSPSRYERHEGIHVLRLEGTDYEMGYQHGVLLKDAIARGPLPYFGNFLDRVVARSFGLVGRPVARLAGIGLGETVGRRIAARFPAFVRESLDGLADGAGIPRADLLRAVTMPETYLFVLGQVIAHRKYAPAPRFGVPLLGCTSVVAWGDATTDGALLHGRNFDYQGVGAWDTEPCVVFHRPKDGQRYVAISAAGVLLGGVTAMNASGLSMVVHQHLASIDFDLGGLPVGVVGDRIMRHARSLDDARRLLDDHVPNGGWTYIVTSAKEKNVLCYEVSAKRRAAFHPEGDTFGYTNMYLSKAFEGTEVYAYPAQWHHNAGRYHRAKELLAAHRGAIDADKIASFLGDIGDARCRFQSAISVLQTVASVVFAPGAGRVYVATGRAPVANQPYAAFDLDGERPRPDVPKLSGGTAIPEPARAAFDAYRAAYEAYFNDDDLETARRLVARARDAQPEQAVYAFVAGALALAAGDAGAAKAAFDRAIDLGHVVPERRASFHLWR
ncbi:MAG TPA: C45 family peptidase, partial [Minicystis sp.]|nr:C45 family peptidase [Minicystis sp.]